MRKNKIDIITLGCSKNLVDSELLMRQFEANGYTVAHDPEKVNGEIVIVNTCGFISDAQEESINMILALEIAKNEGRIGKLFVMGCLSERFSKELKSEIQGVDKYYGKFNWKDILKDIGKAYHKELEGERSISTPGHYAYLKIAEGCNRKCSYCSIPIITGKYKSRPAEEIVTEAKSLAKKGVKELQVIAQDSTFYGKDIYRRFALPELIERLSDIKDIEWIRLHYAYPADFPCDLLRVMRERENVCKYLDIALQHISDQMLKLMRRNITKDSTCRLIEKIRREVPGIYLRTTFMVGHPQETDEDFEALKTFVREVRFERMGVFQYSNEPGTYSYTYYKDDVPEETKQRRIDELTDIQKGISAEINETMIEKTFKTIIDGTEGNYYVGRTEFDSPEIDPEVLIMSDKRLKTGNFYNVKIEKAGDFELYGKI
jgi:ribosomal protein S12 methylthiotransferase